MLKRWKIITKCLSFMSDVMSKVNGASPLVADTVNSSISFGNQCVAPSDSANAGSVHRLISDERSDAFRVVQDYLERSGPEKGLLDTINQRHNLTYSEFSTAMIEYFKADYAVLPDMAKKFIDTAVNTESVNANTVFGTLLSAAEHYFINSDVVINESIATDFLQAFLRLKDNNPSEAIKQSVIDALWNIYDVLTYDENTSLSVRCIMIDTNLRFDRWREESDVSDLVLMAQDYCSFNKLDMDKLGALIDAIKCKSGNDSDKKFRSIFGDVTTQYLVRTANDASVARLLIDAVTGLFEKGEVYGRNTHFSRDSAVFCDLPEEITLPDALICCVNWFFYENYYYPEKEIYNHLPEEASGQKTPRVLSELIYALWEATQGSYNVVELAQSVYQADSDVRRQLCFVESLILLDEDNTRDLPASVDIPLLIDGMLDFYSQKIKTCPQRIQSLLSLVATESYSDRCKSYVKKCIACFYPAADISNSVITAESQETDSAQNRDSVRVYPLSFDGLSDVLRVVKESPEQSDSDERLLNAINNQHELTYPQLNTVVNTYFKAASAMSSDISTQLLTAVLTAEGMSARTVLDTLVTAATAYFSHADMIRDDITQVLMQAFLRLNTTDVSGESQPALLKQAVGNALWNIYRAVRSTNTLSREAQWLMIDANLQFDHWRGESSFVKLTSMAGYYCSVNQPDPERLTALIDVIKCDLSDNYQAKYRSIVRDMANRYFVCNASDASVARLVINAVTWLFENGEMYNKYDFFYWEEIAFDDLPDTIQLPDALSFCITWFFHEDKDYAHNAITYYLPEEQGGRKTPQVLSDLLTALWEKGGRNYDVVKLARSVYQVDNDMRRQLCLVESLMLLEDRKNRHLPAALDLPAIINSVFDINLTRLKSDPTGIQALLSLVASRGYSARCKSYLVNAIARQFAFFCGSEEAVSVSRIMTTYFSSGHCDAQLSDNFMLTMSHCSEHLAGQEAFSALVNNLEHYVLHEHINPEITKVVVRKLIEFRHVDYHEVIRQTLINLSEKDETGEFGELVLSVLPDR